MIVVAIPAFNEEKTIAKVVLGSKKYSDMVLVCSNGSTDMTKEIAESLGAVVISHEKNLGKGATLKSLFNFCKSFNPDIVVTIDADGQHDPNEIPKLLEPIFNNQADIVVGSRRSNEVPFYRRVGRLFLDELTSTVGQVKVIDTQSGFRAYSKKVLDILDITELGFGVESEILMKSKGLRIIEVPVGCKYKDLDTSTQNPLSHAFSVLSSIITVICERQPLRLLGIPGFIMSCAGLYGVLWSVNQFFETSKWAIGTVFISMILLLSGVFMFFTGLILFTIFSLVKKYR